MKSNIEKAKSQSPYKQNVRLLAATKTVSAEIINYATKELGITDIGENRVQELLSKYADLDLSTVNLHFIGRLQRNKVKGSLLIYYTILFFICQPLYVHKKFTKEEYFFKNPLALSVLT